MKNAYRLFFIIATILLSQTVSADVIKTPGVMIKEKHQICQSDADCTTVFTQCDSCECGTPIHQRYTEYYEKKLAAACKNYSGAVCRMRCEPSEIQCVNQRCQLIKN